MFDILFDLLVLFSTRKYVFLHNKHSMHLELSFDLEISQSLIKYLLKKVKFAAKKQIKLTLMAIV